MLQKVKLWFWKWFRPKKYIHHIAEEMVAAAAAAEAKEE